MLDELPSLELAASAVALVLVARVFALLGHRSGLSRGKARAESARARDLIGLALLVGAAAYAYRSGRASTWFLAAAALAIVAQLTGFYLRASARQEQLGETPGSGALGNLDDEPEDQPPSSCPSCGHAELIELVDATRLLGGLNQLTPVSALVCPSCGGLTGQVEDPQKIPIGPEHGTAMRRSSPGDEQEALEEPQDHDG